jgi:FecR protein
MSDGARLVSRSGLAGAPTMAARAPARARRKPAARRPGAWLLVGLLLAVCVPAHGFDGQKPSPPSVDDLALHGSGVPASANWVVLDATGIAAWRAEGAARWQPFTRGEVLPEGCEIETGSDGEVTLVAGGDQLTIAPQGRLIVPIAQPGQDRRLRHERGRILVQIESRDARDVRVDTPLLSLGIKGTTFEVVVEPTQDSVLVHEGDVEVTTPGQREAVDLGTGEGLRQPAVPGSEPDRFMMPALESPAGATGGATWPLPPAAVDGTGQPQTEHSPTDGAGQPQTEPTPAVAAPARTPELAEREARGGSARAQRAASDDGIGFGQLDDLASSWGSIAIAVVGLVILTIPALALLQHLREQWLGRPKPTGERRRQLVRG